SDPPQLAFRAVVVQDQPPILQHAQQRLFLPDDVAERGAKQAALIAHERILLLSPGHEGFEVRTQVNVPQPRDLRGRFAAKAGVDRENPPDSGQPLARNDALGDCRLPEPAPGVRPARLQLSSWPMRSALPPSTSSSKSGSAISTRSSSRSSSKAAR